MKCQHFLAMSGEVPRSPRRVKLVVIKSKLKLELRTVVWTDRKPVRSPRFSVLLRSVIPTDPEVQQQFGMVQGIAEAGQLNALSTLNISSSACCSTDAAY